MEIGSIRHKPLRKLIEKGSAKGVIEAGRVIDMIAFIVAAAGLDELGTSPNFGFHPLTGDRKGTYAMTVTKNWRLGSKPNQDRDHDWVWTLTFTMADDATVADLDLEDYH